MKKAIVVVVALLALGAGAWFLFLRERGDAPPKPTAEKAETPERKQTTPTSSADTGGGGPPPSPRVSMDDDPEGALRLEGQVVDEDEQPVGGATVVLSSNPPRRAQSEPDGSFTFDKLIGRGYHLTARRGGLVAEPVSVKLTAKTEPVILRLKAGSRLEITVVEAGTKTPIAGATVELRELLEVTAQTGPDGKATLEGVKGGWHAVRATKTGYAPGTEVFDTAGGKDTLDKHTIELTKGSGVAGRVVTPDGAPVAGALVLPFDTSQSFNFSDEDRDGVKTDAQGKFQFPALAPGTYRFEGRHSDWARGSSGQVRVDGKNEKTDVVVTLGASGRVAGVVVDVAGKPIAGATVRVASREGRSFWDAPMRQAFTDDAGKFDVKGIGRGKTELVALAEQASSETMPLDLTAKPEQTDLVVKLVVDGKIEGLVVDENGQPIPEAQVRALPENMVGDGDELSDLMLRGAAEDVADAGGHFSLTGLRSRGYLVRASRPGGDLQGSWLRKGTPAKVGDSQVRIVVSSDGTLKGKVLFADGSAPELFSVAVAWGSGRPFAGTKGEFSFAVPSTKLAVQITGPDFEKKVIPAVEVEPGKERDLGTITVEKGRSISGRVVGTDGGPVKGAKVMCGPQLMGSGADLSAPLFGGGTGIKTAESDDEGSYLLSGVGARPLVCAADHGDAGRSLMVAVPRGTGSVQVDLPLRRPGSLEGKVTRGGEPVPSVMVIANSTAASRGMFMVQAGPDGSYRFEKLTPDTYAVTAMDPKAMAGGAGAMQSKSVTIVPEKVMKVDVEMPSKGVALSVAITGKDGADVKNAQIFLITGKVTATNAEALTDAWGAASEGTHGMGFVLKGKPVSLGLIPPGEYSVCVVPFPGEIDDMSAMMALQDKVDKLPVTCQTQVLKAEPATQTISVATVPAPAL